MVGRIGTSCMGTLWVIIQRKVAVPSAAATNLNTGATITVEIAKGHWIFVESSTRVRVRFGVRIPVRARVRVRMNRVTPVRRLEGLLRFVEADIMHHTALTSAGVQGVEG